MIPWLFIAALALLAIAITAAMAVIAVGHQTEERPGYIDLTGAVRRPRRHARAHAPAQPVVDDARRSRPGYPTLAAAFAAGCVRRSAPINELQRANGCICPDMDTMLGNCPVHSALARIPVRVDERVPRGRGAVIGPEGLEAVIDLAENELARQVATQQQPRGGEAA